MGVTGSAPLAAGGRLGVDVLGPLRVRDAEARDVTPEGPLQRRLFALLVLRRGHVVSIDAAVEVLWPERPPQDGPAALHNHVFRLRRRLPLDVVESTGQGYRLVPTRIDLDLDRLVAALGADDPADRAAAEFLEEVLARWHGPAFVDLDDVDDGRAEAMRCAELKVRAREALAEHRLVTGATDGLVAELTALVAEEPLRERPRSLLITALARAGRHAEALRTYDDFRRLVGEELGIAPSPALAAQHEALLRSTEVAAWVPASRLPIAVTSIVGRDALADEVVATVGGHRLVTLIGPGGVGKTRLLIETGGRLLAAGAGRPVVLCELAAADEASAVDVVAAALGIDGRPDIGLADRVATVLGDVAVVLLLDNCEHVLDAIAGLVERLLAACPSVSIIATSRERLRVAGECVVEVPTLLDAEDVAVELFIERARAVAPQFAPGSADRVVVADIVRRLDGLPLGIELAAARLQTLDVHEVASGLDDRFELLSSGYRTSTRHGSLGAAVSWSYGLLDPLLQRAFVDLAVFAGPFTASAAAAVCGLVPAAATSALDRLVERSLVMRTADRRYVLLETLRAFGAERLPASADARRRHAHHHVEWAETVDKALIDPGRPAAMMEIEAALPELRVALDWLLDAGDVERAGRLVAALVDFGFFRLRPDVLAWSRRVLDSGLGMTSASASRLAAASGYAAWMAGDMAGVGEQAARLVELTAARGAPSRVAVFIGTHALFEGRLADAARWYRHAAEVASDTAERLLGCLTEVLALGYAADPATEVVAAGLLDEVGDGPTLFAAYAWYAAGEAAATAQDIALATSRLRTAVELAERCGALFVVGVAGASLASIEARHGDPLVAAAEYRRLIGHWRRAGMWSTQWTMLRSVATLLADLGRSVEAAVLLGAVRATRAGHRIFGGDEAALAELDARLRVDLGVDAYAAALVDGANMDGDAAVEWARRAL